MKFNSTSKFLIVLPVLFFSLGSLRAQNNNLSFGTRAIFIHTPKILQPDIDPGSNFGFGIFGTLTSNIWPSKNIQLSSQIGIDFSPSCNDPNNCDTWWYQYGFRFNTYFETQVFKKSKKYILAGIGPGVFYGNKNYSVNESRINHQFVDREFNQQYDVSFGFGSILSYSRNQLRFSYGLDGYWQRHIYHISNDNGLFIDDFIEFKYPMLILHHFAISYVIN